MNRGISELIIMASGNFYKLKNKNLKFIFLIKDATPLEILLHLPLLCEDKVSFNIKNSKFLKFNF